MEFSSPNQLNLLDQIRSEDGSREFKNQFRKLIRQDTKKVIQALNNEDLSFASLYLLRNEIRGMRLARGLSQCRRDALDITDKITDKSIAKSRFFSPQNEESTSEILRWMLGSGYRDDGLSSEFDEILDGTAALLVKRFGDKSILNTVVEMIFDRNRKGFYKNDLVWILFEACDLETMTTVAEYLLSETKKDNELARKLLSFVPCVSSGRYFYNTDLYWTCIGWLQENFPFIYKTGESFHQSCKPKPYKVSLEAKYLCLPVSSDHGEISRKLEKEENMQLDELKGLDDAVLNILADYSYSNYRRNRDWWNTWMQYPMNEKIRIARGLP